MEPNRHDGLAQLHQRYYPELVRLAFALTGDWSLAEELGTGGSMPGTALLVVNSKCAVEFFY